MTAKISPVLNPYTQVTGQHLEESPPRATCDSFSASNDHAVQLIEMKFKDALDKHIEKVRQSVQCALEKKIANLSEQLAYVEMHWGQEQEALAMSAMRDMGTIEAVFNDLKTLHAQHQLSFKNLSVQLRTSLEESEERQVEHMNETGKRFAETVARMDELEKTLEDTGAKAKVRISPSDLQSETATTAARIDDLSRKVNTCLANVQQFENVLNSQISSLQGNMRRLDARVGEFFSQFVRSSQVEHMEKTSRSIQGETEMCAQEVKNLATKHEEHCHGFAQCSSRLNAAISEPACKISVQEESYVTKVVSHLDTLAASHFSQPSFSGARSGIG